MGVGGVVVVPDDGCQGRDVLGDACGDSGGGGPAVALDPELVLEGVEDGLDPLAQRAQEVGVGAWGLVACSRVQQGQPGLVQVVLQVPWSGSPCPPRSRAPVGARCSSMPRSTSRSSWLGLVRAHATGRAGGGGDHAQAPQEA